MMNKIMHDRDIETNEKNEENQINSYLSTYFLFSNINYLLFFLFLTNTDNKLCY